MFKLWCRIYILNEIESGQKREEGCFATGLMLHNVPFVCIILIFVKIL